MMARLRDELSRPASRSTSPSGRRRRTGAATSPWRSDRDAPAPYSRAARPSSAIRATAGSTLFAGRGAAAGLPEPRAARGATCCAAADRVRAGHAGTDRLAGRGRRGRPAAAGRGDAGRPGRDRRTAALVRAGSPPRCAGLRGGRATRSGRRLLYRPGRDRSSCSTSGLPRAAGRGRAYRCRRPLPPVARLRRPAGGACGDGRLDRVFVKPAHGSSASGVLALATRGRPGPRHDLGGAGTAGPAVQLAAGPPIPTTRPTSPPSWTRWPPTGCTSSGGSPRPAWRPGRRPAGGGRRRAAQPRRRARQPRAHDEPAPRRRARRPGRAAPAAAGEASWSAALAHLRAGRGLLPGHPARRGRPDVRPGLAAPPRSPR